MFRMMSPKQIAQLIPDGAWLGLNTFLALSMPYALHDAIRQRYEATGHPRDLNIYSPCGFGVRNERKAVDAYAGALSKVVTSHYTTMPTIGRRVQANEIEGYCLPLGVMSHSLRAAAAGYKGHLSRVGLNLYIDPRGGGPGLNQRSQEQWVQLVEVGGEEFLYYKTPRLDIALIKGTSVDPVGNIAFSDECVTGDALALAQATRAQGGIVIVQVDRVSHTFERPRSVVIPGILVDYVCVCDDGDENADLRALSGEIHVPATQMDYWMDHIRKQGQGRAGDEVVAHRIIGSRAAKELRAGDVVNIGIGIPETVGKAASRDGILRDIVLTVESGGIGGLPAPESFFGATIGADCIVDMAEQFDFYDGGGLSICFMGALEIDREGNVNVHQLPDRVVGIGGFANITGAAKSVVFCSTFTAKGLDVQQAEDGAVTIMREGSVPKFQRKVSAVSFSAQNALARGQRVLYVTERCVFALTEDGLCLTEVYQGIDKQKQILDLLDFPVKDGTGSRA